MGRHTQANCPARRMRQAAWHLLGRFENEREGPRRAELEEPVLLVVDARVAGQLTQVAAQKCQVMLAVDPAYATQILSRHLVVQMADQRVAGISRNRRDASGMENLNRLLQQARLGIFGVDFKVLRHEVIVGAVPGRCCCRDARGTGNPARVAGPSPPKY